jgi:hypothetical protein
MDAIERNDLLNIVAGVHHRGEGYMSAAMDINVIQRRTADEPAAAVRPAATRPAVTLSYLSTAEVADCTCPEWCERDHDRD